MRARRGALSRSKLVLLAMAAGLSLGLLACAPAADGKDQPDGDGTTEAAFAWAADSDCSLCHGTEHTSLSDESLSASRHSDLSCTTCHSDEEGLAKAHKKVDATDTDGASKLKKTAVDSAVCSSCHDQADLAQKTTDTLLVDEGGTSVNPHDLAESDSHNDIACGDCHSLHKAEPALDTAYEQCSSCHHKGVFECMTCHE